MSTTQLEFAPAMEPAISWTDGLRKGIWPKPKMFWIAALYLALYIIRPWEVLFPELGDMHFERLMVVVVLGYTIACRGFMVKLTMQNLSMVLLLCAFLLSYINAFDPAKTTMELTEFFGITLTFFVIIKAVKTPYQLFFLVACYLVATSLYVFKSEWEYFFHNAARWDMGVKRLAGIDQTHGHPNTFGASMLCSLPIAVFFWRVRRTFCQSWPRRMQKLFAYMLITYVGCAIWGIFLTRSRATTLGLLVFGALIVVRRPKFSAKLKGLFLLVLLSTSAILLAPQDIRIRMQTMVDPSVEQEHGHKGAKKSAEGRWEGWLASVEAFQRYPLTGVGMGSFMAYRVKHLDGEALNAHNLPGELLGETGALGMCAFSFFLAVMLLNARRLVRVGKEISTDGGDPIYALLGIGLLDATVLLLWAGVSGHNVQMYQWYWYAAFAAIGLGFAKCERERRWAEPACEIQEDDLMPAFR